MERPGVVGEAVDEEVTFEWRSEPGVDKQDHDVNPPENPPTLSQLEEKRDERMLPEEEINELKSRWQMLQLRFVDEPKETVEHANVLISTLFERLAQAHAERGNLLEDSNSDGEATTEDLRIAFQQYRSCFESLTQL